MKSLKKILFLFITMVISINYVSAKTIDTSCDYRLMDPWNSERQYDIRYTFSYDNTNSDQVSSYQLTGMFAKPVDKTDYTEYDKTTHPTIEIDDIVNLVLAFPDDYFFDFYIRRGKVCPNICLHRNDDEYIIISEEEPGTCTGPNNKSISGTEPIQGGDSGGTGEVEIDPITGDYKYHSCSLKIGNDDAGYMNRKIKLIFNYYTNNDIEKHKTTWFQGKANIAGWTKVASDAVINGTSFSDEEHDGLKLRVEKSVFDIVYPEIKNNYDKYKTYDVEETAKGCNVDKTKIYVCNTLSDQHGITIITITADESRLEGECTGGIVYGDVEEIIEDDPDTVSTIFNVPSPGGGGFGNEADCKKTVGAAGYTIIHGVLRAVQLLAPVVAIVIAMITLIPAVTAKDEMGIKKATKTCVTIGVVLVVIEVMPYIVLLIGRILGYDLTCLL